jgi:hypothetical protein
MNRAARYIVLSISVIFLFVGAANSRNAGGVILIFIALAGFSYALYALLRKANDASRRKSLETRITGDAEADEVHERLAAEDLRLREYRTKRDDAEREILRYLPANPRGAKRLINHERLYIQIAEDRDIFGGNPELTYRHLAKWVLIIEHWPRLGAILNQDPEKIKILENCANVEDLRHELGLIDPNIIASDEMFSVLAEAIPLSPVIGRLVRFEPSAISTAAELTTQDTGLT